MQVSPGWGTETSLQSPHSPQPGDCASAHTGVTCRAHLGSSGRGRQRGAVRRVRTCAHETLLSLQPLHFLNQGRSLSPDLGASHFCCPGPPTPACVGSPLSWVSRFPPTVLTRLETPWLQATATTRWPPTLSHPFNQLSCRQRNLHPAREWVCVPSSDSVSPLPLGPDP